MKTLFAFLLLLVVSCQKNDQRAVFYNHGKAIDVSAISFYHTRKGHLYLYIKDNDIRNEVYDSKIDSVNFLIKIGSLRANHRS